MTRKICLTQITEIFLVGEKFPTIFSVTPARVGIPTHFFLDISSTHFFLDTVVGGGVKENPMMNKNILSTYVALKKGHRVRRLREKTKHVSFSL